MATRLTQAKRSVSMVLIRARLDGAIKHVREPYNVVALDFGDGTPVRTYLEPAGVLLKQPSFDDSAAGTGADASARAEVYEEVREYDAPPFPKSRMGVLII